MKNENYKLASQIASGVSDFLKKIKKEEILSDVIDLLRKEKNSKKAIIYSPIDLKDSEIKNISSFLTKLTGETIENLEIQKDESLIDGLKIFYKDKLWDFSVSGKIKKLNAN